MSTEVSNSHVHHTACTLDCPDACSLAVTVTDGRITRVDAGPANPFTDGWICAKVRQHAKRIYSPDRVLSPLVRTGPKGAGQFRPVGWEEALGLIGHRMREAIESPAGAASIVGYTYNSSAAAVEKASLTDAVFAAIGATSAEHTICAATASAAWGSVFGAMASADPVDVVHSKLVVIWGANPTVSNTHFPPLITRAVRGGATLVVIDPRRTAMARRAQHHLAVRPGTDVALALAIANRWHEQGRINRAFTDPHATGVDELLAAAAEWPVARAAGACGVDVAAIEAVADAWAATPATMLRLGWGQERNANGGASSRAILALAVLAGSFGVAGAGVIYATGADVRPQRRWPEAARRAVRAVDRPLVPMHQIGRWLAPDAGTPYRVLFVQGSNPAVMCPHTAAVDRALAREDVFTVVHDQVLTDTARFADVVLPATTSFEIDDVNVGYGSMSVEPVRAVICRVGEARSNDEVGLALANTLGLVGDDGQPWRAAPITDAVADPGPRLAVSPRQFAESFPPEGRARLIDPVQGAPRYEPLSGPAAAEPLTLISPASDELVNSMFGEFQSPAAQLAIHPDDAGPRGLVSGGAAVIRNAQGELAVTVRVTDEVRPGVVSIPKGIWRRSFAPVGTAGHGSALSESDEADRAVIHPAGLNLLAP
ncbi:MAG: molybdopterin-dependent oxidoreductase, partial [Acidimicrobiia bacterium]|nr:molybdopterin-dependent oxidoreductase [Acidimicrobiia bacterium]